ncbi:HEAT repeat domain-containing protein [Halostella salina]|uniref:HEAT repeat domain-containing protein n=1 Tax=Halostella salina TaxID=1547897 RepID=UPI000EF8263A|nr:HEAT repeat domain-containing protein [Halostella salina]
MATDAEAGKTKLTVYFTIKIIRLVLKVVLFPFRLLLRLPRLVTNIGGSDQSGYEEAYGYEEQPPSEAGANGQVTEQHRPSGQPVDSGRGEYKQQQEPYREDAAPTRGSEPHAEPAQSTAPPEQYGQQAGPQAQAQAPAAQPAAGTGGGTGAEPAQRASEQAAAGTGEHAAANDAGQAPADSTAPDATATTTAVSDEASRDGTGAQDEGDSQDSEDEAADEEDEAADEDDLEARKAEYASALSASDPATREDGVRQVSAAVESGDLPPTAAMDLLQEPLGDDDPGVRAAVCEALATIGTDAARDALRDLRLDPDSQVSRAATQAYRTLD